MSESPPPPKMEETQIDKQGLGLSIPDTTSPDPITAAPVIMVQNGVDVSSLGENENGEEGLRLEIERGIYRLTLEQAEIEADHNRLEAIDGVEERKDLETVQKVDLDEEKNENDGWSVKGEIENDGFEAGKDVKTEDLEKNKNEKNADSVEEENQLGDEGNEGFAEVKGVKMEDLDEKKIGKDVESVEEENEWGVEENEGFEEGKDVKTENLEEKKKQSVEDEHEWGDDENEGFAEGKVVKTENLDEKKNGKDAEIVEEENQLGDEENEGFEEGKDVKMEYLDENKNGKNAESVEEENGWGVEENEGFGDGRNLKIDLDENTNEKYFESVEEENENEGADELGEGATRLGRNNQSSNQRRMNYPMRPDADDCAYYMKFGSCKFGLNCRFNHPPRRKNQGVKEKVKQREENSERAEQTECKYYRTAGGCTYGKNCKYFHPSDKSTTSHAAELNFLGLPIRLGERECPYYMRTGSCKYGASCRFHHPDPTTVAGGDPSGYGNGRSIPPQRVSSSSVSSWSSPRALNDTSPFMPPIFTPTQGATITPSPAWNGYQAPTYQTSERSLPTPPAFAAMNNHLSNFPMQPHQLYDLPVEEYPERPGEPECSFFLKTGDCKYKSSCKFHHPKNRFSKTKANSYSLSDKGLPLRPDHPICAHYHQYGICKYGPSCKYDHPSGFGILPPPPFDQQQFGNSNILDGADKAREGNASEFSNWD